MKPLLFIILIAFLTACNNSQQTAQQQAATDTNTIIATNDSNKEIIKNDTALATERKTIESKKLIVPGESIGRAILNTNADSLEAEFGKPDMSDAAMGKAWLTWYGKKDEHNNKTQLDIYTAYKDTSMREKTVQQIRTTSSFFSTDNNIHVYSSLNDIRKSFPGIQKVSQNNDDGRAITVYDDIKNGIAFEIADANNQKICIAIFVHLKGKKVTDVYIPLST